MPNDHRTGLLIIRAWVEDGSAEPLHAQVRITPDLSAGVARSLTLDQPNNVPEVVDTWLDNVLNPVTPHIHD